MTAVGQSINKQKLSDCIAAGIQEVEDRFVAFWNGSSGIGGAACCKIQKVTGADRSRFRRDDWARQREDFNVLSVSKFKAVKCNNADVFEVIADTGANIKQLIQFVCLNEEKLAGGLSFALEFKETASRVDTTIDEEVGLDRIGCFGVCVK